MAKKIDIGKQFERDVQDILEELSARHPLTYLRLYDSHAARGKYLPPVPGDYIVVTLGKARLIELKASEKHQSLRSCLSSHVGTHQAAAHRLWARAGGVSYFLFHSVRDSSIELWDGLIVGECRAFRNRLDREDARVFKVDGLRDLLLDIFELREGNE